MTAPKMVGQHTDKPTSNWFAVHRDPIDSSATGRVLSRLFLILALPIFNLITKMTQLFWANSLIMLGVWVGFV